MSFGDVFDPQMIEDVLAQSKEFSFDDVARVLAQSEINLDDLWILLSPAALPFLEPMAQLSQQRTQQRFGKSIKLYAPMYLSNECYNRCTYCGYSMDLDIERLVLTPAQILAEAEVLVQKGFRHILLLTGEAPDKVGVDYLESAITLLNPFFDSIGLEVQPLKSDDYARLIKAGADSLTLYQETYHPETYDKIHLSGKKKQFKKRLTAPDEGGEAGFYRMNVGALMGLYDWRYEAISLGFHLNYLMKRYWQTKLSVSFPRMQDFSGDFDIKYPVSDSEMVQLVCAFRLVFPDLGITLSTRERASFRDHVFGLGITDMSAESKTEPGGYCGSDAGEQFEISDDRSVDEMVDMIRSNGYDPMLKDWDRVI